MIKAALDGLLALAGRGPAADDGVEFVGRDPVLPTPFRIGEATAAILAAYGVLVSDIWQQRTGRPQRVRIDVRHAAATLHGCEFMDLEGRSFPYPYVPMDRFFRAGDGKWIHFQGLFPHLRDGTLALLGCADDEEAIAAATARWNALDLEEALAGAGLCGAVVRSAEDWASHPQGRTLMALPAVEIIRIGDSPPEPFGPAERPLSGVRVLDLTRVLAGPACGRTLAEHGADVIRIGAPYLPSVERCVLDTGHGKLSAFLDLRRREDSERLRELARAADVFSQGYRTGSLARSGLGPEALAELRPGIVYVSMNCYGHEGPWRERPGWEQMAEAATGLAWEQGGFERPKTPGSAGLRLRHRLPRRLRRGRRLETPRRRGRQLPRAHVALPGRHVDPRPRPGQPGRRGWAAGRSAARRHRKLHHVYRYRVRASPPPVAGDGPLRNAAPLGPPGGAARSPPARLARYTIIGGRQVVVVQHVHVTDGGQAVVAENVKGGGAGGGQDENRRRTPWPRPASSSSPRTTEAPESG